MLWSSHSFNNDLYILAHLQRQGLNHATLLQTLPFPLCREGTYHERLAREDDFGKNFGWKHAILQYI